jgi:hypothetical protein
MRKKFKKKLNREKNEKTNKKFWAILTGSNGGQNFKLTASARISNLTKVQIVARKILPKIVKYRI